MKGFLNSIWAMRRSLFAWLGFTAAGFMSMGMLGLVLYYPVYPVLGPFYGGVDTWTGDWVWPTIIAVGTCWPLSFLAAGVVHGRLRKRGASRAVMRAAYVLVLWLGALLVWWLFLFGGKPG